MTSPLDLHQRLVAIAQKAVKQVKDNPAPAQDVLPGDPPTPAPPDPPYRR